MFKLSRAHNSHATNITAQQIGDEFFLARGSHKTIAIYVYRFLIGIVVRSMIVNSINCEFPPVKHEEANEMCHF